MKIMIAGSKTWEDEELIKKTLNRVWVEHGKPEWVELIHGNDPAGADMMCDMYAVEHGWDLHIIKPEFCRDGKKAHDVRNQKMLDYGADIALVFFSRRSHRAEKMVEGFKERGIPYEIFWEEED